MIIEKALSQLKKALPVKQAVSPELNKYIIKIITASDWSLGGYFRLPIV